MLYWAILVNRYSFAAGKMHSSESSTPIDGAQSISPVLIWLKSAILGSQGSLLPPQAEFSSVEIECYRFLFYFIFWLWTKKYELTAWSNE